MAREFACPVRFAQVATLPPAAPNPGVVLEQGARLWFSDGAAWIDLGAAATPLSSTLPAALGTAAVGTSTAAARADHVHALPTPAAIGAAPAVHTHTAAQISDSTAAGRSMLTAADAAAQRSLLNVGGLFTPNVWTGTQSFAAGQLRLLAQVGQEGGEMVIERPPSFTNLTSDVMHDAHGNALRWFYAFNGNHRTIRLRLDQAIDGGNSDIWTSASLAPAVIGGNNNTYDHTSPPLLRNWHGANQPADWHEVIHFPGAVNWHALQLAYFGGDQPAYFIRHMNDMNGWDGESATWRRLWHSGNSAQVIAGTTTGQIARWNHAAARWEPADAAAGGGGGGGTPGGTSGQVQFNNAGAFGGASHAAIEAGRIVHTDYAEHGILTAPPATPGAGRLRVYSRSRAGRAFLEWVGPSGLDIAAQPALFNNRVMLIAPGSGTGITATGITATTAATLSHPGLLGASIAQATYRTRCQTSATAGNAAGIRHAAATLARGNDSFPGGFYFHARVCSGALVLPGCEAFIGLSSSTAALAGAPSALANAIGLVKDAADIQWHFTRRTGTGTIVRTPLTTPLNYTANVMIDLVMFCVPGNSAINVLVRRFDNAGVAHAHLDDSYTTDIPVATTFLAGRFDIRNGATAAAADFELARMYAESDF